MSRKKLQKNVIWGEIGERIRQVRESFNQNQEEFGEVFFKSRKKENISEIESGKKEPNITFLRKFREEFGIDLNFILTGEGSQNAGGEEVDKNSSIKGGEMNDPNLIAAREILDSGTEYGAALAQNIRAFLRAVRHERGDWGQESHPQDKPGEDSG